MTNWLENSGCDNMELQELKTKLAMYYLLDKWIMIKFDLKYYRIVVEGYPSDYVITFRPKNQEVMNKINKGQRSAFNSNTVIWHTKHIEDLYIHYDKLVNYYKLDVTS